MSTISIGSGLDTSLLNYNTGISSMTYTMPSASYTTSSAAYCTTPTVSISNMNGIWGGAEWVNSFPAWGRIDAMCKEYPGLQIAFDNFKTVYNLVKDDYDAPVDKKIRP